MSIKVLSFKRIHTFSLLESLPLLSALTLGGILWWTLAAEALTGALIRLASTSGDTCHLFFPLVGPFLLACSFLEAHDVGAQWSACWFEPRPLESTLTPGVGLWSATGSRGTRSWFLSRRTWCRRWVSSVWSCFWLIGAVTGNVCAKVCCCDKLDLGSRGKKRDDLWSRYPGFVLVIASSLYLAFSGVFERWSEYVVFAHQVLVFFAWAS